MIYEKTRSGCVRTHSAFRLGRRFLTFSALSATVLVGCSEARLALHVAKDVKDYVAPKSMGTYKVGKPYKIKGKWYYPKEDPNYDETGLASWYGPNFHGKATANGAVFDQWDVTAAHKTLPMPTKVRVTNLENGRTLVLTINDRGPFVDNRIIDLSRQSARLLGMEKQGVARVRVQALTATGEDEFITPVVQSATPIPKVAAAPSGSISGGDLLPPPGVGVAAAPSPIQPVNTPAQQGQPIGASNSDRTVTQTQSRQVTTVPVAPTEMYIQAGSFTLQDNATNLGKTLSRFGQTFVTPVEVNGQTFYRVRLGPIASVDQADSLLSQVQNAGVANARVVIQEIN